ncbi:MAG TPA: AMP-binding protein [Candidatus Binatia bacterium]|nr:AMP-binding protein [Candidatus Binatia bacterium]
MRERNEMVLADLIAARAEARPDLDVLTFEHLSLGDGRPDEVRTYADLWRNAQRIAAWLVARGLAPGERFALVMRNHPEIVEALVAASITAGVAVPIDPRTRGEKLAYTLRDSGAVGVVCADYCLEAVRAARARVPGVRWVLALATGEEGAVPGLGAGEESLGAVLAGPERTVDVRLRAPTDPLQIIYTSGTTGDPKGVVFPNARFGLFAMLGALLGYEPDERPYTGLSLAHGNAQAVTLGPSLHLGLRAVFSRRFTKSKLWDVCRAHGCTTFSMLGGMATAIWAEPPRPDDARHAVRVVIDAGMPAALVEPFERRFGVRVFEWYGAIEGGLAFRPPGVGPPGSFGKPVPGLEMRIVDERDVECPPGVVGEIVSRPATGEPAEVEYFGNPAASRAKTAGGWLRSGDMGHRDADGWLFFDWRKGGGIRRNGDFVSPGFVEKVIAEEPSVADVFVYGVPAASGAPGEQDVVAAVVPAGGVPFDPQAVFAACRRGLEPNFVPSWLQVVDEIPKTLSEKPQERLLRERFRPDAAGVYAERR